MIFQKENLGHQLYFITMFEKLLEDFSIEKHINMYSKQMKGKKKMKGKVLFINVHIPYDTTERLFNDKRCIDNVFISFKVSDPSSYIVLSSTVAEYKVSLFGESMDKIFDRLEYILSKESKFVKKTRSVKCANCRFKIFSFEEESDSYCRGCH